MIFVGNYNGDQRIIVPYKFRSVQAKELSVQNLCIHANPVVMLLHSSSSGVKSICLALRILGCGILVASPVVQNLGHMTDFFILHSFHTAKNKIVILGSVELFAQHSNFICYLAGYHKKMADIVYCAQKIRIVIRLKMRLEEFVSVHGHFIFVRVDHQRLRLLVKGFHTFKQSMRCQLIVMVCKCNKIPGRCFYGTVCILGDLQCTVMGDYFDPFIFRRNFFQNSCYRRIIPASVRKTQLPVGICLLLNGLHQSVQIFLRCFVQPYNNGYLRAVTEFRPSLLLQFCLARKMAGDPLLIWDLSCRNCADLGYHFSGKSCTALGFPVTDSFFCILINFFCKDIELAKRNNFYCFSVSCVEYYIETFTGNTCHLREKSCFLRMLDLIVKLIYIHTVCSLDVCCQLFFILVINADGHRTFCDSPAS